MADQKIPHQTPPPLSLEELWRDVVTKCRDIIGIDEDFDIIDSCRDHEQVIAHLKQTVSKYEGNPMALRLSSF
jgi:hypothetical protein